MWNKKYPICIELARQDDFMSKAQGEKSESGEDKAPGTGVKLGRGDSEKKLEMSGSTEEPRRRTSGGGDVTIYLFGRTGREKEEWFRRFLLASRLKSEGKGGSLAAICKSGRFHIIHVITVSDRLFVLIRSDTFHFPHSPNSLSCHRTVLQHSIRSVNKPQLRDGQSPDYANR